MKVAKEFSFSESEVREWCDKSEDSNFLHLDAARAEQHPLFDERIVPGMMLLDRVSGLITQWSETKQGTPVISRMSSVNFDAPVNFDTEVEISIEDDDNEDDMYILFFEVSEGTQSLTYGYITVYLL